MTQKLKDRIALITGASQGIGAAVAKAYAKEGAHVVLFPEAPVELDSVQDIWLKDNTGTLLQTHQ